MSDKVNNPIKEWLASSRSYKAGIELFRSYGSARYPKIWQQVSKGNFGSNRSYLEHYLKKLSKEVKFPVHQVTPKSIPQTNVVVMEKKTTDIVNPPAKIKESLPDVESDLNVKIKSQKQRRLQICQSMHDCKSDAERSKVCDQIDEVNKIIADLEQKLSYYKQFNQLPKKEDVDDFQLADNDDALARQQNRTNANKIGVKKKIDHALLYPEGHEKRKKLVQWQNLYQTLVIRLQLIKDERQRIKHAKTR